MVAVLFDLEKVYDATWRYGIMKDIHKLGNSSSEYFTDRSIAVLLLWIVFVSYASC